jgi:hypothetical protein
MRRTSSSAVFSKRFSPRRQGLGSLWESGEQKLCNALATLLEHCFNAVWTPCNAVSRCFTLIHRDLCVSFSCESVSIFRSEIDGVHELFRKLQTILLDARGSPWKVLLTPTPTWKVEWFDHPLLYSTPYYHIWTHNPRFYSPTWKVEWFDHPLLYSTPYYHIWTHNPRFYSPTWKVEWFDHPLLRAAASPELNGVQGPALASPLQLQASPVTWGGGKTEKKRLTKQDFLELVEAGTYR